MNANPRIIQNQYKLLAPLGDGVGGMGVVYRALDMTLDREVAIKMVRPELLDNQDMERRFQREARALARLNHPNIANIYNFCRDENEYCLIMEFVSGQNLAELLKERGSLPQHEATGLVVQALNGLQHAHSRGVLHRDLKPANLMLTADGTVKILDFGIAKLVDAPVTQATMTNTLTGTVRYMAPELLDNGHPSVVSDLYALNLVLYELLTGRAAFRAPTVMRLLTQIMTDSPPSLRVVLPDASEDLEALINRMMAKQPANRLASADEFSHALTALARPAAGIHVPRKAQAEPDHTVVGATTVVRPSSISGGTGPVDRPAVPAEPPAKPENVTPPVAREERATPAVPKQKKSAPPRWVWAAGLAALLLLVLSVRLLMPKQPDAKQTTPGSALVSEGATNPAPDAEIPSGASVQGAGVSPASSGSVAAASAPPATSHAPGPVTGNPVPKVVADRQTSVAAAPAAGGRPAATPANASTPVMTPATTPAPAIKEDEPPAKPAERPAEPVAAKPESPQKTLAVTKQVTLRLSPVSAYRADQLSKGDVVQFTVNAMTNAGAVPLGQSVKARAVVSEVQAIGGLNTRSYIFLKKMVLETGSNETIKLSLTSSEPEIRFDAQQTNAAIGSLLMRPSKAFSVDL